MSTSLNVRSEWLDAPDVSTPELAATWARYEIWTNESCVTQVESQNSTFRRGVYGALFPLAEWVVDNWWLLTTNARPSSVASRHWNWRNVRAQPWLRRHNVRAAGDGMAWPDLTVVPEGAMTCLRWAADSGPVPGGVRFMSSGTSLVSSADVATGLADIVNLVLERLGESGLHKTRLAEDWAAIGQLDQGEREFCATSARLGLDPFTVSESLADEIVAVAYQLPSDLTDDFFDNAEAEALSDAARWTSRAYETAGKTSSRTTADLGALRSAVPRQTAALDRPWELGYAMARRVREALASPHSDPLDVAPWVAVGTTSGPSHGIQGVAAIAGDRCGLVLGGPPPSKSTRTFASARALGRTLAQPDKDSFLLSATRAGEERIARAFAAELLAPAAGIRELLDALGNHDDMAFDLVASRFGVSPLVIRHQFDNQVA